MSNQLKRFGISEFTTWPWSFERDVERYQAHGIAIIEICQFELNRDDYSAQLHLLKDRARGVSSVQSTVHSLFPDSLAPQPTAPEDRVKAEELGTLPFLEPGESRRYDLEFRILTEADAIAAYVQRIRSSG